MDKAAMGDRLEKAARDAAEGGIIMMELPAESYFEANVVSVKTLTEAGYSGVYVSFQRPFGNVLALLKQGGVDTKNIIFVDAATALSDEEHEKHAACVHISKDFGIDELVRAIYTSLGRLKGAKRFIFIDSLTTITLHKPLSETMRLFEFLVRTAKEHRDGTLLVLNVAGELAQKRFIEDVAVHADTVIEVAP